MEYLKFIFRNTCYGLHLRPAAGSVSLKYCSSQKYSSVSAQKWKQAPPHAAICKRYYSDDVKKDKLKLMDFDPIVWPNIIKTLKNWVYTTLIIKPYLDPEFSLGSFVEGAKHAAEVVSNRIAAGQLDELEGLLTPNCLSEVQKHLSSLNATQRHEIGIKKGDIYFSFPYELGILFNDAKGNTVTPQERFVEITVVHHVLRGHQDMIDRGEPIPLNVGVLPEFQGKIFILNYRFIRNYTKGVSDQWSLNVVNHFKPVEHV